MKELLFQVFLGGNLGFAVGYATDGEWFRATLHALVAAYMIYEWAMTKYATRGQDAK